MPRRLGVPAAQTDMINMPQRVPHARLKGSKPVFLLDRDTRERTPQGILISNDVLMLRHDTLARSAIGPSLNNWSTRFIGF
jgi:hypothetical protein